MSRSKTSRRAKALERRIKQRCRKSANQLHQVPFDANSIIESALQLQKTGKLREAEKLYRRVLQQQPDNADAWHLLGMALYSLGQLDESIECLQCTLTLTPNQPAVLANLGAVYRAADNLDEARRVLEQSVVFQPDSFKARTNLGAVYMEQGRAKEAESQLGFALSLNPEAVEAKMNLGNLWQKQERYREAEQIYRGLIQRQPNNALLFNNLGESLRQQGQMDDAITAMRRAVQLDPASVETRLHLARYLGVADEKEEAKTQFDQLINSNPELSKPFEHLGRMLMNSGQLEQAESCFRSAIARDPSSHTAHGSLLYLLSSRGNLSHEELFEEHRRWGQVHGSVSRINTNEQWTRVRDRNPDRKLRIGYVSPDLRDHVIAYYFKPVLQNCDRNNFEVFCYGEVYVPDEITEEFKTLSDHWRCTVGCTDKEVANMVYDDQIDILVDLAGHTGGNRLRAFAFKPAPVQVTWMGYPNTTGLEAIDYRLTCETLDPTGEPTYHTEELFRLPGGAACFSRGDRRIPDISELPAKVPGAVTFGSLHRPEKIAEATLDLWAAVLAKCSNSKMIIYHTGFDRVATERVMAGMCQRGVAKERFEINNGSSADYYLDIYEHIDIGLDAVPWAGGTTTLEAFLMGVPVIAHFGDNRSGRATASLVNWIGESSLIAKSIDQYCDIAWELSHDLPRLRSLRASLRDSMKETVANAEKFTSELEASYRQMWQKWCTQAQEYPKKE